MRWEGADEPSLIVLFLERLQSGIQSRLRKQEYCRASSNVPSCIVEGSTRLWRRCGAPGQSKGTKIRSKEARKENSPGPLGSLTSSGLTIPLNAPSVSPLASTTTPGQSKTLTPFSKTTSCTSFVHPGVGATAHALLLFKVLIRLLFPTLGCPINPIVKDCLTFCSPELTGPAESRNPLMSSRRGLVEDPEADVGVWTEEAERWLRCCWVEDLKGIVGAWRRR